MVDIYPIDWGKQVRLPIRDTWTSNTHKLQYYVDYENLESTVS